VRLAAAAAAAAAAAKTQLLAYHNYEYMKDSNLFGIGINTGTACM
jgi:hypothetical protein